MPVANSSRCCRKVESERDAGVLLQWSLSLGGANHPAAGKALESIASKAALDPWLAKSLALVNEQFVDSTLTGLLKAAGSSLDNAQPNTRAALEQTINSLWSRSGQSRQVQLLGTYFAGSNSDASPMSSLQVLLLSSLASADMEQLSKNAALKSQLIKSVATSREQLFNASLSEAERVRLVPLVTVLRDSTEQALVDLVRLLGPQEPASVQQAALSAARKLRADQTAVLMLEKWPELLPEVRSSVCGLLLERTAWGQQLVAALEKGTVKANDLDTAVGGTTAQIW